LTTLVLRRHAAESWKKVLEKVVGIEKTHNFAPRNFYVIN